MGPLRLVGMEEEVVGWHTGFLGHKGQRRQWQVRCMTLLRQGPLLVPMEAGVSM